VPSADPSGWKNDLNRFAISCGNYPSLSLGVGHDFVKPLWVPRRFRKGRGGLAALSHPWFPPATDLPEAENR
jgi:hypothetical protein